MMLTLPVTVFCVHLDVHVRCKGILHRKVMHSTAPPDIFPPGEGL